MMCATWNRARVISVELVTSCLVGQSGARALEMPRSINHPIEEGLKQTAGPAALLQLRVTQMQGHSVLWLPEEKLLRRAAMSVSGLGKRC